MSFVFTSLLWGSALVSVPVLIHLINMMRHRKVKWAAMDFLLQSQKAYKRWIVLKQLLLLLLRMLAVAAIVFMVAQPLWRNEWGELFGGAKTHHVVLLDDSYSMSDRWADSTAFERAKKVVYKLAQQAQQQGSSQTFSLIRFSGASNLALGSQQQITQENVDQAFTGRLEEELGPMHASQTGATVLDALEAVERMPEKSADETRLLYIISDFRKKDWNEPKSVRKALDKLHEEKTRIHLVQTVDTTRPNLGITELKPGLGTRAAGVELFMDLGVTNFGDETAKDVQVVLEEDGHPRPGLVIDEIRAGETVFHKFRVNYPTAGGHTVAASISTDAVLTDNRRYSALDIADQVPVLIIVSGDKSKDGYFLAAGLNPGGKVKTGLKPQIELPHFLRNPDNLKAFQTIFIANVDHLEAMAIENLEAFAKSGGGVAFFMGESCQGKFYTDHLYREGEGLFPLPITIPTNLLADRSGKVPDLEVKDHHVFHTFLTMRNNPLDETIVERYFAVPDDWKPAPDSSINVIANLRNGAPLIVERKFGEGRVLAVLTKASPEKTGLGEWNNWARVHSYLPLVSNIQGYLSLVRQALDERTVGQPIKVSFDPKVYTSKVTFNCPAQDTPEPVITDASTTPEGGLEATLNDTSSSGIYVVDLNTIEQGKKEERFFAYNVVRDEGDLHMFERQQLEERLEGLPFKYYRAEEFDYNPHEVAGFNLSDTVLYLLILILIGEQLLAYFASYHPPRMEVVRR